MVYLVSDKNTEYEQFMAETLEAFEKHNIRGLAVVALTDGPDVLTGYWNMDLRDKLQAEAEIRFDSIDTFLLSNSGRYCGNSDDEDNEEEHYESD